MGWAAVTAHAGHFLPHKHGMTVPEKVAYFKRSLHKDQTAIAFLTSKQAPRTLERRSELGWYRAALHWHESLYRRYSQKLQPARPPHYTAWLCIHAGEGSWTANTGNGYYGGLQMDWGFMSSYGGELLRTKGTADHWTPLEQMWVAERAYASGRGFSPWPNTSRMCGLR